MAAVPEAAGEKTLLRDRVAALDELSGAGGRAIIGELEGVLGAFLDLIEIDGGWERAVESAAGASVGLVAWLYQQGGFVTMLHAFAGLCLLVIAAAIILPTEIKVPAAGANP